MIGLMGLSSPVFVASSNPLSEAGGGGGGVIGHVHGRGGGGVLCSLALV